MPPPFFSLFSPSWTRPLNVPVQFAEEHQAELLAIKSQHTDEVARMIDDAQCL